MGQHTVPVVALWVVCEDARIAMTGSAQLWRQCLSQKVTDLLLKSQLIGTQWEQHGLGLCMKKRPEGRWHYFLSKGHTLLEAGMKACSAGMVALSLK